MKAFIDFFTGFIDIISSLIDFVMQTISDLVYMIGLLGDMMLNLPGYFGWLPSTIVTSLVVIFSIVIIYKILGREG